MIYLETTGYNYSKRLCQEVVCWFVARYLPRHKLDIRVDHRGIVSQGLYGSCTVEDCDYRPRAFLIEMHNRLSKENYTKTLLHELQHMLQHVRGDLRDKGAVRLWKGVDCTDMDYSAQPWEIEARTKEETLYITYLIETGQMFPRQNRPRHLL